MEPESERADEPDLLSSTTQEERARRALVEMGYGQANVAPLASVLVAGLLCLGLKEIVERERLVLFLATTAAVSVLRYAIILGFRLRRPSSNTRFWERSFVSSLLLGCLAWGLLALYVLPRDSPFHDGLVFAFLIGMAGGTAVFYAPLRWGAIVGIVAMMAPTSAYLAAQPSVPLRCLAAAGLVFMVLGSRGILILGGFIRRFFELNEELESARQAAEILARTDELTQLLNRRAFYEMGQYLVDQSTRHCSPLSILLIDLDHLKEINDERGHAAGDAALRLLAQVVGQESRRSDVAGRLGGDEFAVLLPHATTRGATEIAERLRDALSRLRLHDSGKETHLTCSVGVAELVAGESLDELILRADQALYRAKGLGRDKVVG